MEYNPFLIDFYKKMEYNVCKEVLYGKDRKRRVFRIFEKS